MKPYLSAQAQIPRSNVGQVAHVSPIPRVTSQEADITRRAPEAACWLRLGCWSNNTAYSHPSPGPFNRRALRSCLVPECSYPPHWLCHQWRLANCGLMPASYTSGQFSNPRKHPTCWASSQCSHTVSSTPCHGAWRPAPLSAHQYIECRCTAPQIKTPICIRRTTHQFIWQQQHTWGALGHGRPQGGKKGHLPPWKLGLRTNIFCKSWSQQLKSNWYSCNDSLVANVTLRLQKSQVQCSGVIQWWTCSSLMPAHLPADAACETFERIVSYCWSILRNKTWQHISKGSLQVTVMGVLFHVAVERKHLGSWCSEAGPLRYILPGVQRPTAAP